MRLVGFIIFILVPFTIHGASLTEKEQSIVALVEEHESEARHLLKSAVLKVMTR